MGFLGTFQDRAIVRQADADGAYTIVHKADLRCRVVSPQIRPVDVGRERNELTDTRYFYWDPNYTFPNEWCQVEVKGIKYNTVAGTFRNVRNPVGKILEHRADIIRTDPTQ